jgi:large subunit ribosomal protein L30
MAYQKVRVTLTGSYIGCTDEQRGTLRALGLRKRGHTREHETTPVVAGMIDKVKHLVEVQPIQ